MVPAFWQTFFKYPMHLIKIFDTTLRDGEQSPGATLQVEEKIQIALQLEKLGVDIIEAGFPVASPDDFKAVAEIGSRISRPVICALSRALDKDIDAARDALKTAQHPRIHTFISSSDIHLEYQMKKTRAQVLDMAKRAVARAKSYVEDVEFSAMDASRSDMDFLCEIISAAIAEGAGTINIPDTVGCMIPSEWGERIRELVARIPGFQKDVILSVHCHNDLGLATANSIAAIENGARQVECTINGLGERAGNASLEEIVMALAVRHEYFKKKETNIMSKEIYATSKMVSSLTGIAVQRNKAIVGLNAFAHESGIHQDSILKKRETFEIMRAEDVGWESNVLVLGKHSGRHAMKKHLERIGFVMSDEEIEQFYQDFIQLADKKKEIFNEDILVLARKIKGIAHVEARKRYVLKSWHVESGSGVKSRAEVELEKDEKAMHKQGEAFGPIDALYKAITLIIEKEYTLEMYDIKALTRGKDAFGEVTLKLRDDHRVATGEGTSMDILEASIKAYIDAANKLEEELCVKQSQL